MAYIRKLQQCQIQQLQDAETYILIVISYKTCGSPEYSKWLEPTESNTVILSQSYWFAYNMAYRTRTVRGAMLTPV